MMPWSDRRAPCGQHPVTVRLNIRVATVAASPPQPRPRALALKGEGNGEVIVAAGMIFAGVMVAAPGHAACPTDDDAKATAEAYVAGK